MAEKPTRDTHVPLATQGRDSERSAERELARMARDDVHRTRTVTCRRCGHPLVRVPDVGWVVDEPTGSYDLCEADPLGAHDPDAP